MDELGLITVREAAQRLTVSRRTVARLLASRELPHVRIGRAVRVREVDVAEFIRRHYRRRAA